jgi:hypothetical protein
MKKHVPNPGTATTCLIWLAEDKRAKSPVNTLLAVLSTVHSLILFPYSSVCWVSFQRVYCLRLLYAMTLFGLCRVSGSLNSVSALISIVWLAKMVALLSLLVVTSRQHHLLSLHKEPLFFYPEFVSSSTGPNYSSRTLPLAPCHLI